MSDMRVHLVFVCKYRRTSLKPVHINRLTEVCDDVMRDFGGRLHTLTGTSGCIHLCVDYPPKHSVSSIVNSLKGVSSRILRKEFTALTKITKQALWSPSYLCASYGGVITTKTINKYIINQSRA